MMDLPSIQLDDVELPVLPAIPKSDSALEDLKLTLHQCARNGDIINANILISNMGSHLTKKINVLDEDDLTPLHYAARHNHLGVLKLLVEHQADITVKDKEGLTPLHYAARFKRKNKKKIDVDRVDEENRMPFSDTMEDLSSAISFLIDEGADINDQDNYKQTPLHYAAMKGNDVAARELLGYKAVNIEANDEEGMTPLHMAACHSRLDIVEMLLNNGALLQCKDNEELTPLHLACMEGDVNIVKMLFNGGARQDDRVTIKSMVKEKDVDGNTCLSFAVENGHYEVVQLCLENGADANMPNSLYVYPLHLAAVNGDVGIVRLLIEHNARIDVLNKEQATPLHKACQYNHEEVVEFLVDREADIERRDEDYYTPLLLASYYGHVATVKLLIQKGADTSAVDKDDKTAIFLAAEENEVSCLEALVQNENTRDMINVSDRYENDPLHIAAENGYLQVVKVLLKNGADLDSKNDEEQTPCHLAAIYGRTNIVRELVARDKNAVNDEDENSNTALHLAALGGHAKVAEVLIEMGADVAASNAESWTPLDCAAAEGWMKTARVLLKANSPIDATGRDKTTPLHLAAKYGHAEVVKLLIDNDLDVGQRDLDGNNCLDLAIDNNNRETAVLIIKSEFWEEALQNSTEKAGQYDTPMRKLIRKMPDVAEDVFNRCMKKRKNEDEESENYKITFNYEFLDDVYSILNWGEKGSSDFESSSGSLSDQEDHISDSARPYTIDSGTFKQNHPLMIMVTAKREDLLAHPLVTALLRHKWRSFGRMLYYINFLSYAVFLVFITGYIVSTTPPYVEDTRIAALTYPTYCEKLDADGYDQPLFAKIGKYFIIALAAWNLLREITLTTEFIPRILLHIHQVLQFYQAKFKYLNWENLIEWVAYTTSLLFVIDFKDCQKDTGYRYAWQWNMGSVAIFLAWINLVLFAQKFPRFGIYVVMFKDVLKTFLQFSLVFILFIIAFALTFYTLLQNQEPFSTVWQSLMKTTVMMIGEFEYDSIYTEGVVNYKTISYLMFCVFMVIMSIIIMNLLVGLAVDNISERQKQAVLTRKAMQVELALDIERFVPEYFRRKYVIPDESISFNNRVSKIKRFFGLESDILTPATIDKALNPEMDKMKNLKNTISKISYNQKEMKGQINNIESMLKAVYENSKGEEWKEEDDTYNVT